jgi:hypothetical protein
MIHCFRFLVNDTNIFKRENRMSIINCHIIFPIHHYTFLLYNETRFIHFLFHSSKRVSFAQVACDDEANKICNSMTKQNTFCICYPDRESDLFPVCIRIWDRFGISACQINVSFSATIMATLVTILVLK